MQRTSSKTRVIGIVILSRCCYGQKTVTRHTKGDLRFWVWHRLYSAAYVPSLSILLGFIDRSSQLRL